MKNQIKLVSDSSADLLKINGIDFANVPLKINSLEKEFVDDENIDVLEMVNYLSKYNGKVSTACPAPGDWLAAFGDAKEIIAVAISSQLSGSYNSLLVAKEQYESEHPDRKVFALDSKNAGSGMRMIVTKAEELIKSELSYEEICKILKDYPSHVGIVFMLESVHNFANSGRVNPIIAKALGFLGICMIAKGSPEGKIEVIDKKRGEKRVLSSILKNIEKEGFLGKRVMIENSLNPEMCNMVKEALKEQYPNVEVSIAPTRGLCSFYAEKGGCLVAFEK